MLWALQRDEQIVSVCLSETQWAAVIAGLYALENNQRRIGREQQAEKIHELRRTLHHTIGEELVRLRGMEATEFTYGFPDDDD